MGSHKLCMIPGPVEFDEEVLSAMATSATSHVSPEFIEKFGHAIELMRDVFLAPNGQPFVVAGTGTLTWDMTAANLVEPGDHVLVVITGIFGDWFAECLTVYGAKVTQVRAPFGSRPTNQQIEDAIKNAEKTFKLITITHVDTSTGVIADIKSISALVREKSPTTLIAVDGVCSVGAEEIRQEEWGIDVVMTASQKAIGVPPGLALMVVSERAIDVALNRKSAPTTYFGSFKKWLPIMKKYEARQPSYFATPAVQLILALETSLSQLVNAPGGMDGRFLKHVKASEKVKEALAKMGLELVPIKREFAANTLSAVRYPSGISGPEFLKKVSSQGIVLAGGLHPDHASEYFRIGHMNVSSVRLDLGHLDTTLAAIESSLKELGYKRP